jgi:predicted TIM-barrel fold metal-dependent hydrolase
VENAGYPYLDEMIAMMYQYPNLYGDLSTMTWVIPRSAFHTYLKALIQAGLGKRLMFGSDQMRWPEMIGKAIEAIEDSRLPHGRTEARHLLQQRSAVSPARQCLGRSA